MSGFVNYQRYISSRHWYRRRKAALRRVDWKCERCGRPAEEVHHLTYERLGREIPEDLQALCKGCHMREHSNAKNFIGTRTEVRDGREFTVYEYADAPKRGRLKQYIGGAKRRSGARRKGFPKQVSTRHVLAAKGGKRKRKA